MKQFLLCCLAMLFIITAQAQTLRVPVQGNQTKMEVSSNTGLSFTANLNISEFTLTKVETPAGYFTQLDLPKFTKRYDNGRPGVPLFSQPVEIPAGANATINIISYDVAEFDLDDLGFEDKILPAQPSWSKSTDPSEIIYYYDTEYYLQDRFSENELVRIVSSGEMRGVSFGNIEIDPVSYNPVTNKIEIKYNIQFTVTFDPAGYAAYNDRKARLYSPLHTGFYDDMPNFIAPGTKDVITEYPIKYVIVSDRMFETALQPFIRWKTEKGFTVIQAYTDQAAVGTTTTTIKAYLQGLYNAGTSSDPAPTYVLFVGDVAQIPNYTNQVGSDYHVTDLYYACYGGTSDYVPDVYYGRFSAQNVSQLTPQIDKTLMYEKYTMPSDNYMDTVLMIAGVDASYAPTYGNGQISYGTDNYFNAAHGIYSNTYLYPASNGSVEAAIKAIIGKGIGYGNYTAHCGSSGWSDPTISTSDIANFNNANKYGLLVGNCCQSVKFEESSCFGEAILRAANEGAVGYIGASDYSYWDEDYYWGVGNTSNIVANPTYAGTGLGAYDKAFHDHGEATTEWFIANGQMVQAGNLAVQASTSGMKQYYWEEYHLMGDPSVMNYFSKPDPLTITYDTPAQVGNTSLLVNTEQYTYVAISLNGVLLDAKYTGTNTSVTLNFPAFTSIDTALVVATKQNKIAHIGNLPIEDAAVALDAQMLSVIKPQGTYACTNIQETPQVIIKNRGTSALTQVTINYRLNGGTLQTTNWTGNLATYQSDTVNLNTITIPNGSSTFLVYTTNPNSGTDLNTANDSVTVSFSASAQTIAADFTVSGTSFCSAPASITTDNLSSGSTQYLWDFGDGTTSTAAEPGHTYNTNGLYTVSLVVDGGVCGSDVSEIEVLVGSLPPVINDTSSCGPASFNLVASGSNINWYDAATGGNLLASGNNYTTPVLSSSTTYYVISESTTTGSGAKPDSTGGGSITTGASNYLIFDADVPFTLVSIDVYASTTGNRTIELRDNAGTSLATFTYNCSVGLNTIPVGFSVPAGTNLQLGLTSTSTASLYRNSAGVSFPYTTPGFFSITNSSYGTSRYYYFYNWQFEQSCNSAFVPVFCSINEAPVTGFSSSVAGNTVTFTNTSTGGGTYLWNFGDGNTSTLENPTHTYASPGTYTVTLTQTNSCSSDYYTSEVGLIDAVEEVSVPVTLFPNPAQDVITVTCSEDILRVEILDTRGALVFGGDFNENFAIINTSALSQGLYYVRVTTAHGTDLSPLAIDK